MNLALLSLFLTGLLVFVLLFIWGYNSREKYRPWIFSLLGGLYALTPLIYMILYASSGGDPGPGFIFLVPPFLPQFVVILVVSVPVSLGLSFLDSYWLYVISASLNFLIWIFIGYLIGRYLKTSQDQSRKRRFWIGVAIVVIACVLFYAYSWGGFRLFN